MRAGRGRVRYVLAGLGVLLGLTGSAVPGPVEPSAATPPEVDFALLRLDPLTLEVLHAYAFSQPYRKIIQPEGTWVYGDLFLELENRGDFGTLELTSRLTGRVVFSSSVDDQLPTVLAWRAWRGRPRRERGSAAAAASP